MPWNTALQQARRCVVGQDKPQQLLHRRALPATSSRSMPWEVVEEHAGFKIRMVPATGDRPAVYTADFKKRRSTPFRESIKEAVKDGNAVMEQVHLRMLEEPQYAAGNGTCSSAPASNSSALVANSSAAAHHMQGQHGPRARGAIAAAVAALPTPAASGPLTGSLVRPFTCYHGALQGVHLLLGRHIGQGGFADVYEASPVEVVSHRGNLQAYHSTAAAAAAAGAATGDGPIVRPRGSLSVAVKVYRSSKEGVADSTLREFAARELHALQLLRGSEVVVQLMAEGELVFTPNNITCTGSLGSLASSAGGVAVISKAAGVIGGGSYHGSCVVLELAAKSLRDLMQQLVRTSECVARSVAVELLQLLLLSQSGELGYIITHRDLKPANILMFDSGRLAVADFGVCHIARSALQPSAAAAAAFMQTAIGTPFYAAPELFANAAAAPIPAASSWRSSATAGLDGRGSQQHGNISSGNGAQGYDASVDVFALGVIVLEMLAGSLSGLFGTGELTTAQMMQQWERQLQGVVDGEVLLPQGTVLSAAALEFIGCCCGVGRQREAAAARGEPKRLTPIQLCSLPFIADSRVDS